jgi:hypothetical protein
LDVDEGFLVDGRWPEVMASGDQIREVVAQGIVHGGEGVCCFCCRVLVARDFLGDSWNKLEAGSHVTRSKIVEARVVPVLQF